MCMLFLVSEKVLSIIDTMNVNQHKCKSTFMAHYDYDIWLFYTLKIIMNILDITSREKILIKERSFLFEQHKFLKGNNVNKFKPIICQMFLNISVQYVNIRFAENMKLSSAKFENEIDYILTETNAYIPRFITRSDKFTDREKHSIIAGLLTLGSGLFSAWRFYKDWTFKRNLKRTLRYILNEVELFRRGILTNRRSLIDLADITHSNFNKMHQRFIGLANKVSIHFHHFTNSLISSRKDTIFYRNYL